MSPSTNHHDDTTPLQTKTTRNPFSTTSLLNLAKDGVTFAKPAVAVGFGIAQTCVDIGFFLPRKFLPPLSVAHCITKSSLQFSKTMAQSSLEASDQMLALVGAQDGESQRLLQYYIDSQSHTPGHETRLALLGVAALLVQVLGILDTDKNNPLVLMQGASQLAVLQEEERQARIQTRKQHDYASSLLYMQYATAIYGAQAALLGCCGGGGGTNVLQDEDEIVIPHPSEVSSLSRHLQFAAAAYGAKSLKFMGACDSLSYWTSDESAICQLCGILPEHVLYIMARERHELYAPAHFVAVDHSNEQVIVAIRGTQSLPDVLVDLMCHSVEFQSVYDGEELISGMVHGGFLKSAQTLASQLHELVAETLVAHSNYELVIVGHSLGGGVATLLALLWARIPLFVSRHIKAISYASPCVVCKDISQAPFTRNHVTCVVTGDDLVSRFGLATFRELQAKLLQLGNEHKDHENNHSIHENEGIEMDNNSHLDDAHEIMFNEFEKDKFYCAGRVWWLQSKEYEPHPIVEVNPVKELHEIGLFPEMFAIHLPKAYMDSLEKLDQGHQNGLGNENDIRGDTYPW